MAGELQTTVTFADGDQVTSTKLNDIISGASFTSNAVTGTTLTVTSGKLKVGVITSAEIGASAVTSTGLADNAVTTAKITDGVVTASKLANLNVINDKIANTTITFGKLATGAVATSANMKAETSSVLVTADVAKHSKGVAKCYGNFTTLGTGRTLSGGYNVASVSRTNSTTTVVTIDNNMDADDYVVVLSNLGNTTGGAAPAVSSRSAGSFTIKHEAEGGVVERISFCVFGNLA